MLTDTHVFNGVSCVLLKQKVYLEEGACHVVSVQLGGFSQIRTASRLSAPASPCQDNTFSLICSAFRGVLSCSLGYDSWSDRIPLVSAASLSTVRVIRPLLLTGTLGREVLVSTAARWEYKEKVLQEPRFVSLCSGSGTLRKPRVVTHSLRGLPIPETFALLRMSTVGVSKLICPKSLCSSPVNFTTEEILQVSRWRERGTAATCQWSDSVILRGCAKEHEGRQGS